MRSELQQAVEAKALVLFIYNGEQRAVKPLAVKPTAGNHYILSAEEIVPDPGAVKSYRLDRMSDVIVTATQFVEPEYVDYTITLKVHVVKGRRLPPHMWLWSAATGTPLMPGEYIAVE